MRRSFAVVGSTAGAVDELKEHGEMRGREVGAEGQENSDGGTGGLRGWSDVCVGSVKGGKEGQNEHRVSCRPLASHRKRGEAATGEAGGGDGRGTHLCRLLLLLLLTALLLATEPTANEERAVGSC